MSICKSDGYQTIKNLLSPAAIPIYTLEWREDSSFMRNSTRQMEMTPVKKSAIPLSAVPLLILMLSTCMFSGPRGLVAQPSDAPSHSGSSTECKSLSIRLAAPRSPVLEREGEILASRIQERSGVKPTFSGKAGCSVELDVQKGIGNEGFRIEPVSRGKVRILGNDNRGLLYGVGKFLRSNTYQQGSFTLGSWRGTSVPDKPLRGIYFATHFFNFYHVAPVEQIQRYVEDLALWGYNAVDVWFDMHHFQGIEDPAAKAMISRLNAIFQTARSVGLDTSLVLLANEAYANSPVAMRADWTAGHDGYFKEPGGHYHVELCPNKLGAKDLMLKWREEMFQAFQGVGADYVVIWPYDQGGCTCSLCKPWGVNGYLTMAEPIAEMARRDFPGCKIILSTWYFDKFTSGEWEGLEQKFGKEHPKWIDYILADEFTGIRRYSGKPPAHRVPGGFPLVSFPEVSMWGAFPWGGFGANPLPTHHQDLWNVGKDSLAGGMPYSEGIFEDLNKVQYAQFFWQKDTPAGSIVDEYIAYEFSPKVVAPVRRAIEILETNYARRAENLEKGDPRFVLEHSSGAEAALNLVRQADKQLSPRARASWRWRILYLRALIDDELVKNNFRVSPRCEEALQELTNIYYAQRADLAVSPPTKEAIERYFRRRENK